MQETVCTEEGNQKKKMLEDKLTDVITSSRITDGGNEE